jgi:hypothetical protein
MIGPHLTEGFVTTICTHVLTGIGRRVHELDACEGGACRAR